MRVTFASNIRKITTVIETAKTNIRKAKIEGFGLITKAAAEQVVNKYIQKGNYARPSKTGKSLIYTAPPGANINKKIVFFNKKTKFRRVTEVAMFIKGKFVSRSGHYEKTLTALANTHYSEGSITVDGVRVEIGADFVRVYADDKSEVFKLETLKQMGKTPVSPLMKTFRSSVNLWSKVKVNLGS